MIVKCVSCQHEWQAVNEPGWCDWCGSVGLKIADDYIETDWLKRILKWLTQKR